MTYPWALVWAVVATAVFIFLSTRAACYVWGLPRLHPRIRRILELRRVPPRFSRPLRSVDVWVVFVLAVTDETTVTINLRDALLDGDRAKIVIFGGHFAVAAAWLVYLRMRYPGAPSTGPLSADSTRSRPTGSGE